MARESRDLMVGGRRETDWAERRAHWSFKYSADPVALQWSELSVGPHHAGPAAPAGPKNWPQVGYRERSVTVM